MLKRRTFLYASAAAAGAVTLGACSDGGQTPAGTSGGEKAGGSGAAAKGSATKPLSKPANLKEAPMLKALVDSGDLPPLAERLPENPYVIPHKWVKPGKYGGNLLMVTEKSTGSGSESNREYMYGHTLLRWLNDGLDIGPGLVESWESNDDASEWTLHFRKGIKWSDGQPWSTADIMFWWDDMVNSTRTTPTPRPTSASPARARSQDDGARR